MAQPGHDPRVGTWQLRPSRQAENNASLWVSSPKGSKSTPYDQPCQIMPCPGLQSLLYICRRIKSFSSRDLGGGKAEFSISSKFRGSMPCLVGLCCRDGCFLLALPMGQCPEDQNRRYFLVTLSEKTTRCLNRFPQDSLVMHHFFTLRRDSGCLCGAT